MAKKSVADDIDDALAGINDDLSDDNEIFGGDNDETDSVADNDGDSDDDLGLEDEDSKDDESSGDDDLGLDDDGNDEANVDDETKDAGADEKEPMKDIFPNEHLAVSVDSITSVAKTNTRGDIDEKDPEFEFLLTSVGDEGVYDELMLSDNGDGTYTLLAGKRRLAAAKKNGLKTVPAVVIKEPQNILLASAIENLTRKKLNPVEEALAYKVLIKELKLTQQELANKVGVAQATISNKLALLDAPKKMLDDLRAGLISEEDVRKALKDRDEKDVTPTIKLSKDDLPENMSMSIKSNKVTIGFKVELESFKDMGKQIKKAMAVAVKDMDTERIESSFKSMVREEKKK